jgi:hypothetical protein
MINYVERLRVTRGLGLYAAITGIVVFGVFGLAASSNHGTLHVSLGTTKHRADIPLSFLIAIGGYCMTVFATVVGSSINTDRRTPLVWTRPISRERLVLSYLTVDVAGILLAFAFALGVLVFVPIGLFGLLPFVRFDPGALPMTLLFGGVAFMWYGVLQGVTAWFRGPGGAVCGVSWGVFVTLVVFASTTLPPAIHAFVIALNVANPLAYVSSLRFSTGQDGMTFTTTSSIYALGEGWRTVVMYGLGLLGIAVAVTGWKRAEL